MHDGDPDHGVRAVVHDEYGPPEVLRVDEVASPVPGADEVLVRVHATTVTRSDCGWRSADPFFIRLFTGPAPPEAEDPRRLRRSATRRTWSSSDRSAPPR